MPDDDQDADTPLPLPPQIGDLTEDAFLSWKHHPVTKLFRKYVGDFGAQLRADHTERWVAGASPSEAFEAEARGRVLTLGELLGLEFEHIVAFYTPDPSNQDQPAHASETRQD